MHETRCRAKINVVTQQEYTVIVAAVPANEQSQPRMSNELTVTLPLDRTDIILPPNDLRTDNSDLYKEFLEVRDGITDVSSAGKSSHLL